MLTLGLIGIVILLIFNILMLSRKVYNTSIAQNLTQSSSRVVSDFITEELRNAKKISLNKENIEGNKYYSLYLGEKQLIKETIENEKVVAENKYGENLIKVHFLPTVNKDIIKVLVTSKENDKEYNLEFEFLLNNIDDLELFKEGSNKIYYIKY